MASEETKDSATPRDVGRRVLLKAATVAGGAVAASALFPGDWKTPVATIGGLPAQAQASAQIILIEPQASSAEGGSGGYGIRVESGFTDKLNDFGGNHHVEYTITPQGSPGAALGSSECLVPIQRQLSGLVSFDWSGTPHQGNVDSILVTTCGFPSKINFRIFLGGHTSAWTGDIPIFD